MPPSIRLFTLTRSLLDDLKVAEKRVARVLLERPEWVLQKTAQEWAQAAQVSSASVIRFCRTLGYSGLPDLRVALAVELQQPGTIISSGSISSSPAQTPRKRGKGSGADLASPDLMAQSGTVKGLTGQNLTGQGLAWQLVAASMQALQQTAELLDEQEVARAAQSLNRATHTEFFALGLSSPVALDASIRLQRLGRQAAYSADAHMQAVRAALLLPTGVAFAISHSGRSPEVLRACELARQRGVPVIAVTSSPRSPLVKLADHPLIVATSEAKAQAESRSSRIAHLALVDILCAALVQLDPARAQAALEQAREAERLVLRRS